MGAFSFGGLDYGTYKLYGDALGKWNPPMIFSLSATSPSLTDITFTEDSTSFMGMLWPLVINKSQIAESITVYPNPVTDYLHIKGLENTDGEKNITLYGIDGSVVYCKTVAGNSEILVPVVELPAGLYLLQVNTTEGRYQYKIAR
jgi:hypothetical protein